jgi:putative ABC transport system permease protein
MTSTPNSLPPTKPGFGWTLLSTAIGLAVNSIRVHKLRSSLTLLGVIIGVASVVLVGSAIEGMGAYADNSVSRVFGANSFIIQRVAGAGMTRSQFLEKLRVNKRIRMEELQYLRSTTGDQIQYSPYMQRAEDAKNLEGLQPVTFENATILGASSELADIREIALVEGRYLTEQEDLNRQAVAVIGDDIRNQLFPSGQVLGRNISVQGHTFRIIGVQERLGSTGTQSQDNSVYIPATVFVKIFPRPESITIFGSPRPDSGLDTNEALDVARMALRSRFHTKPGKDDNFGSVTPDSIRAFVDQLLALVAAVVVPITAISLVVGGIVIMNIMLVSVTERTREIGIRKAVGARASDIRLQFLIEAVILAALGGLIGLGLGAGAATGLSLIMKTPLPVTAPYVLLALFVSSAVGIVSGWYPAMRASRLDPIAALRQE